MKLKVDQTVSWLYLCQVVQEQGALGLVFDQQFESSANKNTSEIWPWDGQQ